MLAIMRTAHRPSAFLALLDLDGLVGSKTLQCVGNLCHPRRCYSTVNLRYQVTVGIQNHNNGFVAIGRHTQRVFHDLEV